MMRRSGAPGVPGLSSTGMEDLAKELKDQVPYSIGIRNIVDKKEMKEKLEAFLASKEAK